MKIKKMMASKAQRKQSLKKLDLSEIVSLSFPDDQYIRKEYPKTQVVLHHTASGRGVNGDFRWWVKDKKRIAVALIIGADGTIYQLFSSAYWAYHLGLRDSTFHKKGVEYKLLDKTSIGIEIDSWGWLKESKGKFYAYTGQEVSKDSIVEYKDAFRGKHFYEAYTPEQIESVRQLLVFFHEKYGISLAYNEDMWDVSENALRGNNGIYTHVSFRPDKFDCHPQPELIKMLKSLKNG